MKVTQKISLSITVFGPMMLSALVMMATVNQKMKSIKINNSSIMRYVCNYTLYKDVNSLFFSWEKVC